MLNTGEEQGSPWAFLWSDRPHHVGRSQVVSSYVQTWMPHSEKHGLHLGGHPACNLHMLANLPPWRPAGIHRQWYSVKKHKWVNTFTVFWYFLYYYHKLQDDSKNCLILKIKQTLHLKHIYIVHINWKDTRKLLGKYSIFLFQAIMFLVYPKLVSTIPLSLNYICKQTYWGSSL